MAAILITVCDKKITTKLFDTYPEAKIEMEKQWEDASYCGEIEEAHIEDDYAWVDDGKDCKDYQWKIEWI